MLNLLQIAQYLISKIMKFFCMLIYIDTSYFILQSFITKFLKIILLFRIIFSLVFIEKLVFLVFSRLF